MSLARCAASSRSAVSLSVHWPSISRSSTSAPSTMLRSEAKISELICFSSPETRTSSDEDRVSWPRDWIVEALHVATPPATTTSSTRAANPTSSF